MKKTILALALTILSTPALAFPVTVESCGKPLTFDAAPKRAVIQDLNMSEMAFALDLQSSMVGVTGITGWYKVDDAFKKELGQIPELASKEPTVENLVAANPDFFFAGWYYGMKPGGDVTPDTLAPYGIKTLVLTESCVHLDKNRPAASMDLLYGDMTKLGKIFGKEQQAEALVAGWKTQLADIKKRSATAAKPVFFFMIPARTSPLLRASSRCRLHSSAKPAAPTSCPTWRQVGARHHGKLSRHATRNSSSCSTIRMVQAIKSCSTSSKRIRQ